MFANDTKIWCPLKTVADSVTLQQDLDTLCSWSEKWQLRFSAEKCTSDILCQQMPTWQRAQRKDLGVVVRSDLKSTSQCNKSAAAVRRIIAMIKRHFRKLDTEDVLLIYKTYIRPRLEFCIQSWSPHLSKDIETLERVQKTATKLVPQLRKFNYE